MRPTSYRRYEAMSPFEIKDALIALARQRAHAAARAYLDAGRGNPNWIATEPRAAFFLLGRFAVEESCRGSAFPAGLGGLPEPAGIASRLLAWLDGRSDEAGARLLARLVPFVDTAFAVDRDAAVHELVEAVLGDHYPFPVTMLPHAELFVARHVARTLGLAPETRLDLFAVEGATAGICAVFRSLRANRLLAAGDAIAIATPIFTPYLDLPVLEDHALTPIELGGSEAEGWQLPDAAIDRLADPSIRALVLVNPGNPTSVAMAPDVVARLSRLVAGARPDLIVVTDDVYAPFVEGFRSVMAALPGNTIGLYSFSKFFGCTGWRLGVVALARDTAIDRRIAALPEAERRALDLRYRALSPAPRTLRFVDRLAADSRDVALNHTAGLSTPQQAMMALFALAELMDEAGSYRGACRAVVAGRARRAYESLGIPVPSGALDAHYYGLIDFERWLEREVGADVARHVAETVHPLDIVFRLAAEHGIVGLNGGGFDAPDWSVRLSFANLPDEAYDAIGHAMRSVAAAYVRAWHRERHAAGGRSG